MGKEKPATPMLIKQNNNNNRKQGSSHKQSTNNNSNYIMLRIKVENSPILSKHLIMESTFKFFRTEEILGVGVWMDLINNEELKDD